LRHGAPEPPESRQQTIPPNNIELAFPTMARSKNSNKKAKPKAKDEDGRKQQQKPEQKKEEARIVTMQALRELSDDDDDEQGELPVDESKWDSKAQALKAAIESGRFDQAIRASANKEDDDDDDEAFEEASLNDEDEDGSDVESVEEEEELAADDDDDAAEMAADDNQEVEKGENDGNDDEDDEEENSYEDDHGDETNKAIFSSSFRDGGNDDDADGDDNEEDDDDDDTKQSRFHSPDQRNSYHAKALRVLAEELDGKTRGWPWAETFDVMPKDPLPFDIKDPTAEGAVSIHDDLKREVTFYDVALKAVLQAKTQCADAKIPFSRPEDFFAEMVKSDGTFSFQFIMACT
jgi:rRNA-processing protein EBP2